MGFKIFSLQIINGSYYQREAQRRSSRIELIHALRGKILDRNGKTLVEDSPAFDINIIPALIVKNTESINTLALLLKLKPDEINKRLNEIIKKIELKAVNKTERERKNIMREGMQTSYVFWLNIPLEAAVEIVSTPNQYPGAFVRQRDKRNYLYGSLACHAIGYMGRISPEEYQSFRKKDYLKKHLHPSVDELTYEVLDANGEFLEQQFGRFGVEKQLEGTLTGIHGVRMVELDFANRSERELSRYPSTDGTDVSLTIDLNLQKEIEPLLKDKTSSVIVMDINNGEIWAMASSPSFNPNSLQSPVSPDTVKYIFQSPAKPLYNRVIAGEYAPGSLFKIVTATAALESKKINGNTEFNCTGAFSPNLKHFKCWTSEYNRGHGPMTIVTGLQHSCNVFFFNAGKLAGQENILGWTAKYGFGQKTGINLEGEQKGLLPSPEQKLKRYNKSWALADTLNISIGQGDLMVTPIQVVRMVAAVANGGKLVTPHIVRTNPKSDKDKISPDEEEPEEENIPLPETQLNISKQTLSLIRQGLYEVVHGEHGTASNLGLDKFSVAGKTSTAEVSAPGIERRSHAWFVGFAPFDKPRFAFVVMLEHGGKGSENAAPIAASFMETAMQIN